MMNANQSLRGGALVALLLVLGAPVWSQSYQIEDLGTLGGNYSAATGINQAGHVCGNAITAAGPFHAFRWIDGVMTDLGTLSGSQNNASSAASITNTGKVVGSSDALVDGQYPGLYSIHAALWALDYKRDLSAGDPPGLDSRAWDMNDFGVVAGVTYYNDNPHPTLWTPMGRLHPRELMEIFAVNAAGHALGLEYFMSPLVLLWRGNEIVEIQPELAASPDTANWVDPLAPIDLNASEQVVFNTHGGAWRWTDGRVIRLGPGTYAEAINDAGSVVGSVGVRAFLYTDAEGLVDLNSRLGGRTDWMLQTATDLNNAGQIVGVGLHNGLTRAFRLTPIPTRHGRETPIRTYP